MTEGGPHVVILDHHSMLDLTPEAQIIIPHPQGEGVTQDQFRHVSEGIERSLTPGPPMALEAEAKALIRSRSIECY
ncbi:unnamed protein product [Ilex paraguariensis]|uniref:DUF5753 domain-containing protein n=1 Tax=Ilex paraguariensis TaxID=185542 RepID=A0ABC8SHA3_9AQUA